MTLAARSSSWYAAVPRFAYLKETTSPCSVRRMRPRMEPAGCAAMRSAQRGSATAHRSATPVEEGERHSQFVAQPGEPSLDLAELPVRGKESSVLVGIGVSDHHLLHSARGSNTAPYQRDTEQVRMMTGARCRSSIVSNSGTMGRVQLSVPAWSAKSPASLARR